jgi:hypothetical protein
VHPLASADCGVPLDNGPIRGRAHDHTHPVFRITLKEPADVQGKLLAKLLMASSRPSAGGRLPLQRGRAMALKPRLGAHLAAAALPAAFTCDRGCQAVLRKCLEDTPFSSEFCVFLYSNCYHLCHLFGTIGEILDPFD